MVWQISTANSKFQPPLPLELIITLFRFRTKSYHLIRSSDRTDEAKGTQFCFLVILFGADINFLESTYATISSREDQHCSHRDFIHMKCNKVVHVGSSQLFLCIQWQLIFDFRQYWFFLENSLCMLNCCISLCWEGLLLTTLSLLYTA